MSLVFILFLRGEGQFKKSLIIIVKAMISLYSKSINYWGGGGRVGARSFEITDIFTIYILVS